MTAPGRSASEYRDKAATIWLSLTPQQQEECRLGIYPTGALIDCQGEGYSTLALLRALQEHCPKEKGPTIIRG